jgi:hypothetical protein
MKKEARLQALVIEIHRILPGCISLYREMKNTYYEALLETRDTRVCVTGATPLKALKALHKRVLDTVAPADDSSGPNDAGNAERH